MQIKIISKERRKDKERIKKINEKQRKKKKKKQRKMTKKDHEIRNYQKKLKTLQAQIASD
jgi:hypothetical protein